MGQIIIDFDKLKNLPDDLQATTVDFDILDSEDLSNIIHATKNKLESVVNNAKKTLDMRKLQLEEAEKALEQANQHSEESEDTENEVTSLYYERYIRCKEIYENAVIIYDAIAKLPDDYDSMITEYKTMQNNLAESYHSLITKSKSMIEEYIHAHDKRVKQAYDATAAVSDVDTNPSMPSVSGASYCDINHNEESKIDWKSVEKWGVTNSEVYEFADTYSETSTPIPPKDIIPDTSGNFVGETNNSLFIPTNSEALKLIELYGYKGVEYKNGQPDFTPFSVHDTMFGILECTVEIGHMTSYRENPHYEYGRRSSYHAEAEDIGNYAQADIALAKKYNLSPKDIKKWRESSDPPLTWHECADMKTVQLIPTIINHCCPHVGGTSWAKYGQKCANTPY